MLILERFEGDTAVIETSAGYVYIPRAELSPKIKEGDILTISPDKTATAARRGKIAALQNKLFSRKSQG